MYRAIGMDDEPKPLVECSSPLRLVAPAARGAHKPSVAGEGALTTARLRRVDAPLGGCRGTGRTARRLSLRRAFGDTPPDVVDVALWKGGSNLLFLKGGISLSQSLLQARNAAGYGAGQPPAVAPNSGTSARKGSALRASRHECPGSVAPLPLHSCRSRSAAGESWRAAAGGLFLTSSAALNIAFHSQRERC
jgi:hypothetical protein